MVPCTYDDVLFPKDNTFFVNIESGIEIVVNTLKINGQVSIKVNLYLLFKYMYDRYTKLEVVIIPASGIKTNNCLVILMVHLHLKIPFIICVITTCKLQSISMGF
jgi:hypothetical protein